MGPLAGIKVLELAGLAPGPFAATMLSDLGAEVLRLDRAGGAKRAPTPPPEPLGRGRRSVAVDLKHPQAASVVLDLVVNTDVLIEGFRPGVCERLGIGPDACLARNQRLIYGRLTGWGQDGPMASRAGHDINYLALSGALYPMGPADSPPVPPINYVADFGGGGMLLAVGVLAALYERERSGIGQVIDSAMTEGAGLLSAQLHGLRATGLWNDERGGNPLDGSAPFYGSYQCRDGGFVAVGAIEPQFYAELIEGLGLRELPQQFDRASWPATRALFAEKFAERTRDEWSQAFDGVDACVTAILRPDEAPQHPHNVARGSFTEVAGLVQPATAPRFSRTPGHVAGPAPRAGEHTRAALADWGVAETDISQLLDSGAISEVD